MNRTFRRAAAPVAAAAIIGAVVTSLLVGSGSGPSVAADGQPAVNTVAVNGLGRVAGVPDVLRLEIGVQETGNDVNAALNASNNDVKKIKSALDKYGVKAEDVQTSQLSINPRWEKDKINGYDVAQSLTVKLRNLAKAGQAISDAAAAGGNATRIDNVSFDIEDNADLISGARDAAFADAKAKAEQYAKLSGRKLGRVSTVSENTDVGSPPQPYAVAMDQAASAKNSSVPIEAGSQQVTVTSTVVWELV